MTVAENWDELKNTGAVDPIKQGQKAIGGLAKVFDVERPFFSLDRLEGAGEALSGVTGAVYGTGTQIGKFIADSIPTDFSDQIVDGIVGLFGGETNADREKKQKEIEEKQKKEWEERKKKREEEIKKKEDADRKANDNEEKKKKEERDILMQGQKTASAGNTAGAVSDTAGVNVANLSDVGNISTVTTETPPSIIAATDRNALNVTVNQPSDKPIPVVLTDEKGVPLINSADRKEGVTLADKLSGQTGGGTPAGAGATTGTPQVAPTREPSSGTPWLTPPKEMGPVDSALAAASNPVLAALHQTGANTHNLPGNQWSAGQAGRTGNATQRTNNQFGGQPTAIESAKAQAVGQDQIAQASMPSGASQPVSTNPPVPGATVGPPPKGRAFLGWAKESVKSEFIKRGYSPEQAEIFSRGAAAQLVQETGWNAGSKQVGQNNFFNIKETKTQKGDVEGKIAYDKAEKQDDVYAGYSTPEKGIAAYVDFLTKNPRYAKAGLFESKSSEEYAQALQKASFATDPRYAKNISSIMNDKKLTASISAYQKQTPQTGTTPGGTQSGVPPVANFSTKGLKFKNKKEAMGGGNNEQGILALANNLQSNVSGMKYITAMNDEYHQSARYKAEKIAAGGTGKSTHQDGTAMDFTINDPKQSGAVKKQVEEMLKAAGVKGKVIDEYKNKTAATTGGHIHVNFKDKKQAEKYAAFVSGQKPQTPDNAKQTNTPEVAPAPQPTSEGQISGTPAGTGNASTPIAPPTRVQPSTGLTSNGLKANSKLQSSTDNHTTKALGVSAEEYNVFKQSIANIESRGGEYGITGGANNHYQGAYQMGEAAKKDAAKLLGIKVPTREEFLANPELQEKMFDAFTANNHKWLMKNNKKYAQLSPKEQMKVLGYAHNQGMGGANKWLKTGKVGKDAFGTKADKYAKEIEKNMKAFKSGGGATTEGPTVAQQPSAATPASASQPPVTEMPPTSNPEPFLSAVGDVGRELTAPALTAVGNMMTTILHQDEAYTHNLPGHQWSSAQGSGGRGGQQRSITRTNTQFGGQPMALEMGSFNRNPILENTVTGLTPPPAEISTLAPNEIQALGPRMAQNYNLLGMPNVQASLDALQAGGAQMLSSLTPMPLPGVLGTGLSAVDALRQNGALGPMINGDVAGLIGRVAPEISSSINGLQGVYNQSLGGGGGFAHQFNQATGGLLKGTGIPRAMGAMLGGASSATSPTGGFAHQFNQATGDALKGTGIPIAIGSLMGGSGGGPTGGFAHQFNAVTGNALKGTGIPMALGGALGPVSGLLGNALGAASNLFSSQPALSPLPAPSMGPVLESAGFNDKNSEVLSNATAQSAMMAQVSGKRDEPQRGSPERGSSLMEGQTTGMEVRNPESSIRKLTDMIIGFSFG